MQPDVRQRLMAEADTVLKPLGLYVVDLEVESGRTRSLVRLYVDTEDGARIDVSHCSKASHAMMDYYDTHLTFGDKYALEVSSPGIERRVARPRDFVRFAGQQAQVRLSRVVDGRRNLSGVLAEANDTHFSLVVDGQTLAFPYSLLSRANLVYDFTKHKEDADGIQSE